MADAEGSTAFFTHPESSGVRYEIDDHVYVSPPYSKRSGEPYLVARILEILRPKPGDAAHAQPRVKLAFYLRPRDISSRYIADHRVLLATMHADDSPISYIRGKCRVYHRERLPCDLEAYKREPDSFYYHQLYDRYLHRYFDLIPTERVQNAPADALTYLNEHFEFVCCEVGMGHELSDALRGCTECHKWAANAESVNCAVCKKIWHLQCVEPPLSKKPPAGYGWSCAPCSLRHEEDLERYIASGDASMKPPQMADRKAGPTPQRQSKGKESAVPIASTDKMKQTNGWPFRYFGQHSDPTTITDPHDSFYPRASTRVGHKFQISAIYLDGDADPADRVRRKGGSSLGIKRDRNGQPKSTEGLSRAKVKRLEREEARSYTIHSRGGEETVNIISIPFDQNQETQVDVVIQAAMEAPLYQKAGVNYLTEALAVYCKAAKASDQDLQSAKAQVLGLKLRDIGMADWSETEVEKFNEGIAEHQDDLEEVAQTLPRKTVGDVVNYYYLHRIDLESQLDQQHDDDKWADGVAPTGLGPDQSAQSEDENESVAEEPASEELDPLGPCAICETREAKSWYKCPGGIGTAQYAGGRKVMCPECSIQWRHCKQILFCQKTGLNFADASDTPFVVEDLAAKKAAARAARALAKLPKIEDEPVLETEPVIERPPPPPKPVAIPKPCVICKKFEPKSSLATCSRCGLSGHFECCGLDEASYGERWLCLMCGIWARLRRAHPHAHCAICPPRRLKGPSDALNALDLYKPTVDHGFVHAICAVLHSELSFQDADRMDVVEGVISIPATKWAKECFVCNQSDAGACVKCADCSKHFHVSCAWQAGYKFAFEIQPVKKKKQTQGVSVQFQEEVGAMDAKIWCRSHKFRANRIVYDFAAKDTNSDHNALQIFVRNYKTLRSDGHPLLRRALRLDSVCAPALLPAKSPDSPPTAVSAIVALDMPLATTAARSRALKAKLSSSSSPPVIKARTSPVRMRQRSKSSGRGTPNGVKSLKVKLHLPAQLVNSPPRWEYEDADQESAALQPDQLAIRASLPPMANEALEPSENAESGEFVEQSDSRPILEDVDRTASAGADQMHDLEHVDGGMHGSDNVYRAKVTELDEVVLDRMPSDQQKEYPGSADDHPTWPADNGVESGDNLLSANFFETVEASEYTQPPVTEVSKGFADAAEGSPDGPSAPPDQSVSAKDSNSREDTSAQETGSTAASHAPAAPQPPDEDPPPSANPEPQDAGESASSSEDESEENVSEFEEEAIADQSEDDDYIEDGGRRPKRSGRPRGRPPKGGHTPASLAAAETARAVRSAAKPAHSLRTSHIDRARPALSEANEYLSPHLQPATQQDIEMVSQAHAYPSHDRNGHLGQQQQQAPQHQPEASTSYAHSMQSMPTQPSPQYQHPDANLPMWDMAHMAGQVPYGYYSQNGYYGGPSPDPHYQHAPDQHYYAQMQHAMPAFDDSQGYPSPASYEGAPLMTPGTSNGPRLTKAGSVRRRRSPIPSDATCYNCQTAQTPVWRRDDQHHILCNSCGQYWKAHARHRPMTLKGPKRQIHKYAPQGQPPPGALIKNSAQDKEMHREKLAAMLKLPGSSPKPGTPPGVSVKRTPQARPRSLPPSQPVTPSYPETTQLSPFPQHRAPSSHDDAAQHSYMGSFSRQPYSPGYPMPVSRGEYYQPMYEAPHTPQPPGDISVVEPSLMEHSQHPMPTFAETGAAPVPESLYGNGVYEAASQHTQQHFEIDPALAELGTPPMHAGHHDPPQGYSHLQQWGQNFASQVLPPQ